MDSKMNGFIGSKVCKYCEDIELNSHAVGMY